MIAGRRIAPKPLLQPVGSMKQRIVLLSCPRDEPDSPQAMDEWQSTYYVVSRIQRLPAAKHHLQRSGWLRRIFGRKTALG